MLTAYTPYFDPKGRGRDTVCRVCSYQYQYTRYEKYHYTVDICHECSINLIRELMVQSPDKFFEIKEKLKKCCHEDFLKLNNGE